MRRTSSILVTLLGAAALGTMPSCAKNSKGVRTRDSGQSSLMGQTFAGQNACNPENHKRPFIIEWDATDSSMFEALAADDVVVVRYEGCSLTILDECRNESVRGSQGAYKPPEWTAGALEKIEIHNEGELVAKLPLGAATLGGRVSAGESFRMEYFVAGTRTATRASLYRNELAGNPGCEGATHFVHGYNLGAFALGSAQELDTEVNGSAYGFGAQGTTSSGRSAEKKGGDLGVCKSDSATEVQGCKAPIRLSLREIRDGDNPDAAAMATSDTDASLSAAATINTKMQMSDAARAHLESAKLKQQSGDGKGCLAELDAHDALEPTAVSTDPKNKLAVPRGVCLMMSGKCDAGKGLMRKALAVRHEEQYGAEHVDNMVAAYVGEHCQGGNMSDKDALLRAVSAMRKAAMVSKESVAYCDEHLGTIERLRDKVDLDSSPQFKNLNTQLEYNAPQCYARAGDCTKAFEQFKVQTLRNRGDLYKNQDAKQRETTLRTAFEGVVAVCKGK